MADEGLEQDDAELLRRLDVEALAGEVVDLGFQRQQLALDLGLVRPGEATRTAMAGIPAILRRVAPEAWELRVDRACATWVEAWLRSLQGEC